MKTIITEIVVPRTEVEEIFSPQRIRIRLRNEGAGNYVAVEGINDEPMEGESSAEMYFETEQQIDEFARICKNMLNPINPKVFEEKIWNHALSEEEVADLYRKSKLKGA